MKTKIESAIGLLSTVEAARLELDKITAAISILERENEEHAALVAVADAAENVIYKNSDLWPQSVKSEFVRAMCNVNDALDQLDAVRAGKKIKI